MVHFEHFDVRFLWSFGTVEGLPYQRFLAPCDVLRCHTRAAVHVSIVPGDEDGQSVQVTVRVAGSEEKKQAFL